MNVRVWSNTRGLKTLKLGITLEMYKQKVPDAVAVGKRPSIAQMEKWVSNGRAKAVDGCKVEPDGTCTHGLPSWIIALNFI